MRGYVTMGGGQPIVPAKTLPASPAMPPTSPAVGDYLCAMRAGFAEQLGGLQPVEANAAKCPQNPCCEGMLAGCPYRGSLG